MNRKEKKVNHTKWAFSWFLKFYRESDDRIVAGCLICDAGMNFGPLLLCTFGRYANPQRITWHASKPAAYTVTVRRLQRNSRTGLGEHSDLSVGAAVLVSGVITGCRPVAASERPSTTDHTAHRILWPAAHARSKDIVRLAVAAVSAFNKLAWRACGEWRWGETEENGTRKTTSSLPSGATDDE